MVQKSFDDNTPLISISVAAELLGIHPRTLMLYEYEKILVPRRSPTNRRMYSANEIRQLKFIQYLTRKRKVNFAGIRIIFSMLKAFDEQGIDMRPVLFPDFKND